MKSVLIDNSDMENQQQRDSFDNIRGLHATDNHHQGAAKPSSQVHKPVVADDEDMDPTEYFEDMMKAYAAQKEAAKNLYPLKFNASMSIFDYIEQYGGQNSGENLEDVEVSLAGHITNKSSSSSKLFFYDLHGGAGKVQVMADARRSDLDEDEFFKFHYKVKHGDIVGTTGFPGKSKTGELSIFSKSFVVLSHCLHMMPQQNDALGSDNANVKNHFASDDEGKYKRLTEAIHELSEAIQETSEARQKFFEDAMKENIDNKKVNDELVLDMPEGPDHNNKKEQANDGLFRLSEIGLANIVSLMGSNPPPWATHPASQRLLGFSGAANAVGYVGTTAALSLRYTKPGVARIFANVGPIGCAWGVIMGFTSYLPGEFQWLGYVAAAFCTLAVLLSNY